MFNTAVVENYRHAHNIRRVHIFPGFFPIIVHSLSKGMAEKFTNTFRPWYIGSFKWAWWISFALGYVQYSVIFMETVWRWTYLIILTTLSTKILIYYWIKKWHVCSYFFSQVYHFQTEKVWPVCSPYWYYCTFGFNLRYLMF